MRKLFLMAALLFVPVVAFSIDTRRIVQPTIAVLQTAAPELDSVDYRTAVAVRDSLVFALRRTGFEAADMGCTADELYDRPRGGADYYVEVLPAYGNSYPTGSVAVSTRTVAASVGVMHLEAGLRIYDGRTFQQIAEYPLHRDSVLVIPIGVGVGVHRVSLWLGFPLIEYARYRAALRGVTDDAVRAIEDAVGIEP